MPGAVGGAEREWGSGGVALLASHCHCASGLVGHAMTARMLWALWARRFKCAFPDGPTEPIPGWVRGCEVSEREACSLQLAVGARPPRPLRGCQRRADCRGEAGTRCRRHSRLRGVKHCEAEDVVPAGALCRFAWVAVCPSRLTISETARWWRTRALECPDPLVVAVAT